MKTFTCVLLLAAAGAFSPSLRADCPVGTVPFKTGYFVCEDYGFGYQCWEYTLCLDPLIYSLAPSWGGTATPFAAAVSRAENRTLPAGGVLLVNNRKVVAQNTTSCGFDISRPALPGKPLIPFKTALP